MKEEEKKAEPAPEDDDDLGIRMRLHKNINKWGEIAYEDTGAGVADKMAESSNEREYRGDSPGKAYEAIMIRDWKPVPKYEDTFDYLKEKISETSNEEDYLGAGPGQAY